MTRDDICVMALKAGFDAYISQEHWGDVFAVRPPRDIRSTELAQMLTTFARHVEAQVKREAKS